MTTAIDDFDSASDAFAFADWALQSGIWNGREVAWTEASEFCEEVQSRILETLFNSQNETVFDQFASQLAWIGNSSSRDLITRDIQALDFSTNPLIVHAGLGKSLTHFWKKHKKEILIGAAALAVVTVVVVVAVATSGAAVAGTALGGAALDGLKKRDDAKPDKKPASQKTPFSPQIEPVSSNPKPFLRANREFSADGTVHFGEKAVVINGQYSTYEDILRPVIKQPYPNAPFATPNPFPCLPDLSKTSSPQVHSPILEPLLPKLSPLLSTRTSDPNKSWVASTFETIEQGIVDSNFSNSNKPPTERRSCRIPSTTSLTSHLRISGINGMNTSYEEANAHAQYLSNFIPDQTVDWIYNRSHGSMIDLGEIFTLNYSGISPNTSRLLAENWIAFHKENIDNPNLKYLQFCHSQGALHVRNTLAKLPKEICDRIIVVAIAPAGVVPDDICYKSFNYASKKDIVHFGELVYSGGLDSNECGISKKLEMILEYREQLILLDPHPNAKGIDHEFQSPTFSKAIKDIIAQYFEKNGEYQ